MQTYELWNDDNTKLVASVTTEDALKISKMVAKGYLLVVVPDPAPDHATEKLGEFTFTASERSWTVIDKTQSELDDLAAAALEEDRLAALADALAASQFKGYTIDQAKEYSDLTAVDVAGIQKVFRKLIEAVMSLHPFELK